MKLELKNSNVYPPADIETNGHYSIDVLILFDDELYIGYYNFKNHEWRWHNEKATEELTFVFDDENDLKWALIN